MVAAPSLLEEVVQSPESLARMRNVQKIVTGGGKYKPLAYTEDYTDRGVGCWQVLYLKMPEILCVERLV